MHSSELQIEMHALCVCLYVDEQFISIHMVFEFSLCMCACKLHMQSWSLNSLPVRISCPLEKGQMRSIAAEFFCFRSHKRFNYSPHPCPPLSFLLSLSYLPTFRAPLSSCLLCHLPLSREGIKQTYAKRSNVCVF